MDWNQRNRRNRRNRRIKYGEGREVGGRVYGGEGRVKTPPLI